MLEKLADWPSIKKTKYLLILSILLMVITSVLMRYFFFLSKYPVGFMESQLSFSGAILKEHYKSTNITYYRIAQILDYGYMVGYGTLAFSLALIIARKYDESSNWRKSGYVVAVMGVLGAICDGIENVFILAMLTDPSGFPDIWAIIHSCFALVKYILLFSCIGWALTTCIVLLVKKKKS